jgi:hypothetical protein
MNLQLGSSPADSAMSILINIAKAICGLLPWVLNIAAIIVFLTIRRRWINLASLRLTEPPRV